MAYCFANCMKVRLVFRGAPEHLKDLVEMDWVPRVGELLQVKDGECEVLSVLHTPQSEDQAVVLELGKKR